MTGFEPCDLVVPIADARCSLLTSCAVVCGLTCALLLLRLGPRSALVDRSAVRWRCSPLGDRTTVREALRLLAEIMTQGRAGLFTVLGYVQEPSKDVLDVRELFTVRISDPGG